MVQSLVNSYLKRLGLVGLGGVGVISALFLLLSIHSTLGILVGYVLSFLFVASNFFLVQKIDLDDQKRFLTLFFVTLTVRFVLVLVAFALVLAYIKIDQILFTISFIISYILHSVIEIIFINQILENRHED